MLIVAGCAGKRSAVIIKLFQRGGHVQANSDNGISLCDLVASLG
jgi:hypothetical protein